MQGWCVAAPAPEVRHQLLADTGLDPQQDAAQDRFARGFQHPSGDEPQQRRLADLHSKAGITTETIGMAAQVSLQGEFEIIDNAKTLEFTVDRPHPHGAGAV